MKTIVIATTLILASGATLAGTPIDSEGGSVLHSIEMQASGRSANASAATYGEGGSVLAAIEDPSDGRSVAVTGSGEFYDHG